MRFSLDIGRPVIIFHGPAGNGKVGWNSAGKKIELVLTGHA